MYCSSSLLFETTRTFSDTRYEPQARAEQSEQWNYDNSPLPWVMAWLHTLRRHCFNAQDAGCRSLPQTDLISRCTRCTNSTSVRHGLELSGVTKPHRSKQCSTMKVQCVLHCMLLGFPFSALYSYVFICQLAYHWHVGSRRHRLCQVQRLHNTIVNLSQLQHGKALNFTDFIGGNAPNAHQCPSMLKLPNLHESFGARFGNGA